MRRGPTRAGFKVDRHDAGVRTVESSLYAVYASRFEVCSIYIT